MYDIFKFSAQKVIDQKYFGKLNGQLNYANYIFKEKECTKENQFKGAGIYGVFLDEELIYVGKFQGQKKDWTRGNVVKSRWTKHVGTLTMLDKNVSFKPTIYILSLFWCRPKSEALSTFAFKP